MLKKTIKVSQLLISILLSIILLINIFLPNYVLAIESPSLPISTNSPELKIDSRLIQQFKQNDHVTFLLKFKEQVDTNKISTEAKENAKKQKQTAAKTELIVRSAVISSLRNTAIETQNSVLDYLEQAKQKGDVDSVESFYVVNAIAVTGSKEVMDKLATYPEVAKILPNETRQLITPIRNKVSSEKSSSTIEWGVERVGAPQAWKMGIDGTGIVVANIDTGVQWDHPALKEKYRGYNPSNPNLVDHSLSWFDAVDGSDEPYDDLKHGTHVMGTIVGAEPNGSNQIGVAPGAKWIAVKAFSGDGGTDVDLLEAGEWILAPKDSDGNPHPELAPDIVNNSWGGGPGLNEWYRPMVQNWRSADIFPVFAAGNNGDWGPGSISNPSNYPESFAVGATDSNNKLTYFSSRGPGPYDDSKPNVSAPGANIRSATPTNQYEDGWNGTSMATPHISGVIALLKQANASLSIDQIEKLLEDTAIPLTDSEYPTSPNYGYGHGFVNAYNAIKAVQGSGLVKGYVRYNGIDVTKPTYQHTSPSYGFDKEDLPLTIQVQDNISLQSIKLIYQVNGQQKSIEAKRTAGDYKNGTYQANIPGIDVKLNKFTYYWMIEDFGKNQVISNSYEVKVKPAITLGYFQNFESTPEGWYSEGFNNDWEWGIPTKEPDKAFSGEKVYATNLEGANNLDSYSYLNMPPIELPVDKNVYLTFKHWYDINPAGWFDGPTDFGAVLVSTDKQNWEVLSKTEPTYDDPNNPHYSSDGWIDGEADLSAYAGKRIYIAFYMQGEDYGFDFVPKSGWAIDDISLSDTSLVKNIQKKNKANTHIKKDFSNVSIKNTGYTTSSHQPVKHELPIGAQITLLESGYSVGSNPADGFYSMYHSPGNFTIRAEAYGFLSKDQPVTIQEDGIVEANLILEPIEKGKIEGIVKDKETGKPLSNAIISLIEDAAILPVKTDHKGRFSLTAYEGNYSLHVYKDDYVYQDIPISISGKKDRNQKIELQKYIGFTGEIGYDDGTGETSWFWPKGSMNGMAVKMSLEKGVSRAWLKGGLFKVNTEIPTPGYTRFQVAVYDSSGLNGAPGKKIAGPFEAHAKTDSEWTYVDLLDKEIYVSGDYYITYIQPESFDKGATSLYSDQNGPFHDRNWLLYNGIFEHVSDPIYGNFMIRAVVNNSLQAPVIESPLNNSFTNESKIVVKGKATPSSTIIIQKNGKDIATGLSKEDGSFAISVNVKNGENKLTAVTVTKDGRTEPSEAVNIILDQKKPEITINKIEKIKGKQNEVIIFGKVKDDYLDSAFINDKQIVVDSKGSFKEQIIFKKEESKVVIYATDKAENSESKTIKIK